MMPYQRTGLFCVIAFVAIIGNSLGAAVPEFRRGDKASVLIFTTTDCPIANAMLPEITRIQQEFSKKGITFTLVQVDPDTSAAAVREHAKSYGISIPYVLYPKHELV